MTDPSPKRAYHHGDLRAALLAAAEAELAETGMEGFTLRGCARRAGVSHAAPKHHFGDVTGLLTAVAVEAFGLLCARIEAETRAAPADAEARLMATAAGYFGFAMERPELFQLMFRTERLRVGDAALIEAGQRAFALPLAAVAARLGRAADMADPQVAARTIAFWSQTHGFAVLALARQFGPPGDRAAMFEGLLRPGLAALFGVADAVPPSALAQLTLKPGSRA